MKISVVITAYNLSRYIEQCLRSILSQTHVPYEIIIADDCSSDDTLDLAKRLVNSLVVVRQQKNGGALLNTLAGLKVASGDVVAFIDGDDTWPPQKLARVAEEFSADPSVVLVTHAHRRVDADGRPTGKLDETHSNIGRILKETDDSKRQEMFRRSILRREGVWFGSAYSVRRSMFDLNSFTRLVADHPSATNGYLDLVLAPYIVASNPTARIVYMDDVVFDYRIHGANSASSDTIDKQLKAIIRGRSTNLVTRDALLACGAGRAVLAEFENILEEYDFLTFLYTHKYFSALRVFLRLIPFFTRRGRLPKELARLILVALAGPAFVLRNK
jgi:glycosyltransferase involved in cell wall biosynthesis